VFSVAAATGHTFGRNSLVRVSAVDARTGFVSHPNLKSGRIHKLVPI